MTIQDMINAGIRIQGAYKIEVWKGDDEYEVLAEGSSFEDEIWDIEDDILESEVGFIYTVVETSYPNCPGAILVIEVVKCEFDFDN